MEHDETYEVNLLAVDGPDDPCIFECPACIEMDWTWAGMGDHAPGMPPECLAGESFPNVKGGDLECICRASSEEST